MPTENNQDHNYSETSKLKQEDIQLEQESIQQTQPDVEFVNPNTLISRQTPSEMSGSKVKRLRKKIRERGFDAAQPIEVANIDGKLIILDGHHRVVAARQLRLTIVAIRRREVSQEQAEQLLLEAAEAQIYRSY
ncbi:ParB N-terminal domain-containing protein [Iningainema tapete]|uniref:ParB N-terminal domain-containing protein n=1 Tax=Iningainema tapete BLCC-T55 TaxID=2748662 RepID=A0A8J6XSS7_9CYAN|nr:ParB N-terminal domain-containing protein [Iningainema tapete]MBD2773023.1 ParB N-terminal domain-containing protein [Iningainema tapete BLCC-T55]